MNFKKIKKKKKQHMNIYAKAPVWKRNKFYLTFSHGILAAVGQ